MCPRHNIRSTVHGQLPGTVYSICSTDRFGCWTACTRTTTGQSTAGIWADRAFMWVLNVARLGVLWLVFCHLSVCCGEKDLHAFVCAVSRNRPTLPLDVRPRVASGGGGGEGIFFFFFDSPRGGLVRTHYDPTRCIANCRQRSMCVVTSKDAVRLVPSHSPALLQKSANILKKVAL